PTAGGASRPGTEDLGTGGDGARAGIRERSMGAGGEEHLGGSAPGGPATAEDDMPDDGLGVPTAGQVTGREAATDVWPAAPAGPCSGAAESESGPSGHGAPLLPHDETDRWEQRIRQVSAAFVDEPRAAVEQADRALEEIAARFDEAVARRRRTLRMAWEGEEGRTTDAGNDTEQLRLALRDYRELAGRLLHL
ncbi:hypothetical protein, partial [Streptomyces sp. AF1A]|uniref:hypothetical protein n=1 Tax=Streptomyces sp. AF1A TaxID=3394350 RepID=UPI0039BD5B97